MSLEASLDAATAAMKDLTAALMAAKAAPDKASKAGKAEKTAEAPTVTKEQATAAAVAVKNKFGMEAAQALIKSAGKASELKKVAPENYAALVAACDAKMTEEPEEATEEDDGL